MTDKKDESPYLNKGIAETDGQWKEPSIEHLETGHKEGVSPENDPISDNVKTTTQAQQDREEKLKKGKESMDIQSGPEGQAKKKQ